MVIEGRTWLELLTPAQCWEELAKAEIGRVAVLVEGRPEIYPVNFVVDDRTVVFRTEQGSKLRGLLQNPSTCFEVDGVGQKMWSGWSVVVKGTAERVTDPTEAAHVADLPLRYWAYGDKPFWIRICPTEITGRRIYRPKPRGG